ncbi:MAG: hypothetical protein RIQ47_1494 [Bacteroidota bacterium]
MRTPQLIQRLFSSLVWRIPQKDKIIYLTFDDGPIPEVTPWVLDELEKHNAKATFFCIGNNVRKHPDVYKKLQLAGHRIGNHTENHLNGWTVYNREYYMNIAQCRRVVKSDLFRPPYGKIRPSQIARIRENYRIIMWDVLSKDYDISLSGEEVYQRVVRNTTPGSIIVMHDSLKAEERLRYALPRILAHFTEQGYKFAPIPD